MILKNCQQGSEKKLFFFGVEGFGVEGSFFDGHGYVAAFDEDVGRGLERCGGPIDDGFNAGADEAVDDVLGGGGGNGNDPDGDIFFFDHFGDLVDVVAAAAGNDAVDFIGVGVEGGFYG